MRPLGAILLALVVSGCSSRSLNTFDDIKEGVAALTGSPVTARTRLERILTAHDRTDASSWPLLPNAEGESQLRLVLRDLEKLESIEYEKLSARYAVILVLGDIVSRSQSPLVRSRAALAVARLGKPLALDPHDGPRRVDDKVLGDIFLEIKMADAAVPPAGEEDTPELRTARRAALVKLSEKRFWPPPSFDLPLDGAQDAFRTGRKWSRSMLDFGLSERFRPDWEDPAFGPEQGRRDVGLAAEVVRYTVSYALLRDPDEQVRFDAVAAAAEIGTPDMVPVLASAVKMEGAPLVRLRLAQALGEVGDANRGEAVPTLVALLRDLDTSVRHAAHRSLQSVAGEDVGEDPAAWLTWWAANRGEEDRS